MKRTQIQLPDRLYRELQKLAQDREWSVAEAVRRSVEMLLRSVPKTRQEDWTLPEAQALGAFQAPVSHWRARAQEREP